LFLILGARSSPAVRVELDPVSPASHWPKLVTQLAIINGHACMHSRKVIKIQGGGNGTYLVRLPWEMKKKLECDGGG